MANLPDVIRATQASARAVDAMARWQREITHAERSIAWHALQLKRGLMSANCARQLDDIAAADILHATRQLAMARGRYERANLALKRNPL
jgi:hypothetical protein